MDKYKFIEFLIETGALKFGDFLTKSGRKSPYFFNFGNIASGQAMDRLGDYYAEAFLQNHFGPHSHLYGPAYKGISLSVLLAQKLYAQKKWDLKVSFNRKERKDHGEGGSFIGAALKPKQEVVIIEDVLTAGTSLKESLSILEPYGVTISGLLVGVDRMEKGQSECGARQEIMEKYHISVRSIITMSDVLDYLRDHGSKTSEADSSSRLSSVQAYINTYCVANPSSQVSL